MTKSKYLDLEWIWIYSGNVCIKEKYSFEPVLSYSIHPIKPKKKNSAQI